MIEIKYSNEIPPIYEKCKKNFGVDWKNGLLITYGDTVYSTFPITEDLKVHEATNIKQQLKMGVEKWWNKYFEDAQFRLSQEVEAYRNQLVYINKHYSRKYRKVLYEHIVNSMCSMYGDMCNRDEAIKLLL